MYEELFYTIRDLWTMRNAMEEFKENVEKRKNDICNEVSGMNAYWNDTQYAEFKRYMESIDEELAGCLRSVEFTKSDLDDFIRRLRYDGK